MRNSEIYNLGVRWAEVKVYSEIQEDNNNIYQNFRLVASNFQFLKYFTDTRFLGYNILEEEINKHYIGNGENIFYEKKIIHNNLSTVVYRKVGIVNNKFDSVQFVVRAPIPVLEGCICCIYWRKKYKRCSYCNEIGLEQKSSCEDFRQKENKIMDKNLLEEIAEKLGTTIENLLEEYGDEETVIEKFNSGELKLLND
jgi:hypothetical protein